MTNMGIGQNSVTQISGLNRKLEVFSLCNFKMVSFNILCDRLCENWPSSHLVVIRETSV